MHAVSIADLPSPRRTTLDAAPRPRAAAARRLGALALAAFTGLGVFSSPPAQAGMASGWWGGTWNCTIDGRPARMKWKVVSVDEGSCSGDVCTSASSAAWKGEFSDNGSRWVPLTRPQQSNKGGVFFTHADGNRWYLAKPVNRSTTGYTTWQGKRYPLSCRS